MSPLRAVIFDLDGTLLNTETAAKSAARQVLRELGGNEWLLQRHAEAEKQVRELEERGPTRGLDVALPCT